VARKPLWMGMRREREREMEFEDRKMGEIEKEEMSTDREMDVDQFSMKTWCLFTQRGGNGIK
jgi:hypothetical protein